MFEKVIYRNHINEEIEFGTNGMFVNESDLHNYSWKYKSKNDKISTIKNSVTKLKLPVIIKCSSLEEGISKRNALFEIVEKDVLSNEYGKIIIGDYYLKCYVMGSKKSKYMLDGSYMKATLEVVTDLPQWVKETTISFGYNVGTVGNNMDFNNDFPMDYTSNLIGQQLNNTGFIDSNFRITIYGACENPEIVIAGHSYQVDVPVDNNEYLTIDSIEKQLFLHTQTDLKRIASTFAIEIHMFFRKYLPEHLTFHQAVHFHSILHYLKKGVNRSGSDIYG